MHAVRLALGQLCGLRCRLRPLRHLLRHHLGAQLGGGGQHALETDQVQAEPEHKQSSGLFVPGEGPGHWPGAACKVGRGTNAASRCINSSGDITRWVVPSRQGVLSLSTHLPGGVALLPFFCPAPGG